jgi:branched-chain amino acid transport system substrate-binding protein
VGCPLFRQDRKDADLEPGDDVQRGPSLSEGSQSSRDEGNGSLIAEMRKTSVNDPMTANGVLRPDGRLMRDVYLVEVKTPTESSGPWDYEKLSAIIPADKAFRPLSESACPLIKWPP